MPISSHILMIAPIQFGYNEQTAVNNSFQQKTEVDIQQKALNEFNSFVLLLRSHGISVTVIKDTLHPITPDAIFPNNWISFHEDNCVVLYPMFAPNRRLERKPGIIQALQNSFLINKIIDLTKYEEQGKFLEGTGSMVLDREHKMAYACLSRRTDPSLVNEFCRIMGYTSLCFEATDVHNKALYHTNVMMCIGDTFAVICLEAIRDIAQRNEVENALINSGKKIIPITLDQMIRFAGNMLQVINDKQEKLLVMSTQAFQSLTPDQIEQLLTFNQILHAPLNHIEAAGGGSARCMMAEIFNTAIRKDTL